MAITIACRIYTTYVDSNQYLRFVPRHVFPDIPKKIALFKIFYSFIFAIAITLISPKSVI